MFSFLDKDKDGLKKASKSDDTEGRLVAPGTEISYKKSLINKYTDEHQNLQRLFELALAAYQQAKDEIFLLHLRELQIALRKHLLDEELNLYIYLRHCYRQDKDKQELITAFKKGSKKTGVKTFAYIRQYTEEGGEISRDEAFLSDLLEIGNTLGDLIISEEHYLYPIYQKPADIPV